MNRLTCKYGGETALRELSTFDRESTTEADDTLTCEEVCGDFNGCDECPVQKAFNRLAEYEDTELTPKQIQEIKVFFNTQITRILNELQQYKDIEKQLREEYKADVDIKMIIKHFIETIFKGEKHERFCILTNEDAEQWDGYKAIGTVEECREAVEKQKTKKPLNNKREYTCPICGFDSLIVGATDGNDDYCCKCGQHIDWSE